MYALVLLLGLGSVVVWRKIRLADTVNRALTELVYSASDHDRNDRAVSALVALGESAHPQMARAFRGEETTFEKLYRKAHRLLPSRLKERLILLPSAADVRRALGSKLHHFGPVTSRALVGVVELGFDPALQHENIDILRSLYWSIPESSKATLILSNYLGMYSASSAYIFGMTDAREIWPGVPQLAPVLTNWLKNPEAAGEAIEALGLMGEAAGAAIPMLLDIAENGIPGLKELIKARALAALCELGERNERILALTQQNWTSPNQRNREIAAYCVAKLGAEALPILDSLLGNLDRGNVTVLQQQLTGIGSIGAQATAAVSVLLDLSYRIPSEFAFLQKTPAAAPVGFRRALIWSNEDQPGALAAAFALAEIDLEAASHRLELIASGLRTLAPSNAVIRLRAFKEQLIPALEAYLESGKDIERMLVAHHLLVLDPENLAGRRLLEEQMSHTNLEHRANAASWLFRATGETNTTLPVLAGCLAEMRSQEDQLPLTVLQEFGEAAKPLGPKVRPFLEHPDWVLRYLGGKALRSIAPELMPRIVEE